jgi:hypothetical protein
MTHHCLNGISLVQAVGQGNQHFILGVFKRLGIASFQFNADGKCVAVLTPSPTRLTSMPGPLQTGHKLDQFAVAANEKMG